MATIFEHDREGNEYEFYLTEGQCPECGAPCVLEIGQNEISPDRIDCPFCGHREGYGEVIAMDKDLEEIVAEIKSRLAFYRDDPYGRGMADGAMMVLAYYDPKLFHQLFHNWVEAKKTLANPERS